jgi:hypothetical protein
VISEYLRATGSYALQTRRPPWALTEVGAAVVAIGVSACAGDARTTPSNGKTTQRRIDDMAQSSLNRRRAASARNTDGTAELSR